jgi:hypothetical protein
MWRTAFLAVATCGLASCNGLVDAPDPVLLKDASTGSNPADSALPDVALSMTDANRADASFPIDATAGDAEAAADGNGTDALGDGGDCCATGCTDLSSDPRNCGACGHDCRFSGCTAGLCEAVPIAQSTNLWSLWDLTIMNGQLYGTDWYRSFAAVYTVAPDASVTDPTPLLTYGVPVSASPISNDGTSIFFDIFWDDVAAVPAGIYALDTAGHAAFLHAVGQVGSLGADDSYVYWTQRGTISVMQKDGGGESTFSTTSSDAGRPLSALVAGGVARPWVYFQYDGALVRAKPPGLDVTTSVSGADKNVATIALDSTYAYWLEAPAVSGASASLFRVRLDLSQPAENVTPLGGLAWADGLRLLADPTSDDLFYFATGSAPSTIYRLKKDASQPAVRLVTFENPIIAAAQDGATLYFTTYGSQALGASPFGGVWRLTK